MSFLSSADYEAQVNARYHIFIRLDNSFNYVWTNFIWKIGKQKGVHEVTFKF